MDNGNCSEICMNTIPYHHCACHGDGVLTPTGTTCIHNVQCSGKDTNFTCSCLPGYQDTTTNSNYNCTGRKSSYQGALVAAQVASITPVDTDECSEGLVTCPSNSHCVNNMGGHDCLCDDGYFTNGSTCCEFLRLISVMYIRGIFNRLQPW